MRQKRLLLLGSSALMLLCLAGVAAAQTPPDFAPATTTPPTGPAPHTPGPQTPAPESPPQITPKPQTTPTPPGTTPISPITVTAPPAPRAPPRLLPPTATPTPTPPPERPTRAPTFPQRTAVPSTPAAAAPTQTQIFDQQRDNIFAPVGAASTTWSREAIEGLPQGSNTPFEKALLQFPGVSQDSAAEGSYHFRNEHLESSLSFRINGILLPDTIGAFGQFLDPSFVGSLSSDHRGAPRPIRLSHRWCCRYQDRGLRQQRRDRCLRRQQANSKLQHPIRRQNREHGVFLRRPVSGEHPGNPKSNPASERRSRSHQPGSKLCLCLDHHRSHHAIELHRRHIDKSISDSERSRVIAELHRLWQHLLPFRAGR